MRTILVLLLSTVPAAAETYYAHIGPDNVVDQVLVADPAVMGRTAASPSEWIQTYMNPGAGQPKNYAGIGYAWNPTLYCFVPPKPPEDVVLDQDTCLWASPRN